jgi:hypothetical protein
LSDSNEERHDDVNLVISSEHHSEGRQGQQKEAGHGHVATSELVGQQAGRECSNLEVMELEDLYKD